MQQIPATWSYFSHQFSWTCAHLSICAEDPSGPKRSNEQQILNATKGLQEKTVVKGVKGPSWLRKLTHYDTINGTAIDYMHCVLLGVVKLLLSLWIRREHHSEGYYIGRKVVLIDKQLEEIKPPFLITHKPCKLSVHFKHYKASEYRAFYMEFYHSVIGTTMHYLWYPYIHYYPKGIYNIVKV